MARFEDFTALLGPALKEYATKVGTILKKRGVSILRLSGDPPVRGRDLGRVGELSVPA